MRLTSTRISLQRLCAYSLALASALVLLSGCTVAKVVHASLQPTSAFYQCTADSRIECQPGSESLAAAILPVIDHAQATVEKRQYCRIVKAVVIRTYASPEQFSLFSGSAKYAEGAASLGVLHLSPKLLATPERIPGIVTHELSHLSLALQMGTWSWANLPGWFHEGLATWVSDGGGAETITSEDAVKSIKAGHRFVPEDHGSPLMPRSAASYGLRPHMYYRQAAIFVGYLHDENPMAFERLLRGIEQGARFSPALESAYGESLDTLWRNFLGKS